jgi:hypothetical protein
VADLLGRHVGPLERRLDGDSSQLGGRQRREAPAQLADRRTGRAEDDGSWHVRELLLGDFSDV